MKLDAVRFALCVCAAGTAHVRNGSKFAVTTAETDEKARTQA
jgi:hypothetical protein